MVAGVEASKWLVENSANTEYEGGLIRWLRLKKEEN